jgi:uncharacterized protein (TIGR02145 family)
MIGKLLDKYELIQELGEGGMANVYAAHDSKFDAKVSIKILNKEFVHNEHIRKRFLAEARNMYKMSHTNIVKVTDLIDDGNTVAFVMEFIDGETLKQYRDRKGKLSDEEINAILPQMLEALSYVHDRNLVHRDVKPSNFMIDNSGRVKLLDFGIAKNTNPGSDEYTQTGTHTQMGTPMYMSPEQITETKSVTAQSDIYSLGVVLWQFVTGKKPYNTNTLSSFQVQMKIVQEPLSETNTFWDKMIMKATQKDPKSRYASCNIWLNELKAISNQSNSHTQEKTVFDSSIKEDPSISKVQDKAKRENNITPNNPSQRKKWLMPLIIALVVILFGMSWFELTNNKTSNAETEKDLDRSCIDQNGNVFDTVRIGDQTWMDENLNVDKFSNGDPIPEAKTEGEWKAYSQAGEAAWCFYENDPKNGEKYGKLYNWYTVNDPRGLAPKGWHIPTDEEWTILTNQLGGESKSGAKMKTKDGWKDGGNGTNSSGFLGLPGGFRDYDGRYFEYLGITGSWWSSTESIYNALSGSYWQLSTNDAKCESGYTYAKGGGFSIRCIRDQYPNTAVLKNLKWEGDDNNGYHTYFQKINNNEWVETHMKEKYFYEQIEFKNDTYVLKDKNRTGLYIRISNDKCYLRDTNYPKWTLIYFGRWK